LLATGIAGTEQIVEQAVDNEERAAAALRVNRAKLSQQVLRLDVLDGQERQARASVIAQRATADLARIDLGYTSIVAPVRADRRWSRRYRDPLDLTPPAPAAQ
jgi:multidrug resistance efflux pump